MPTQLIVAAVLFLLSLLGAYVLFKVLKSAALIKRPGYQAGGALAGFLLLFGTLTMAHFKLSAVEINDLTTRCLELEGQVNELRQANLSLRQKLVEQTDLCEFDLWTIKGKVFRQDRESPRNIGIVVGLIPHYTTSSKPDGSFTLRDVKLTRAEQYLQDLQFSAEGYWPDDKSVDQHTAVFDIDNRIIELQDPVELWPQEPDAEYVDVEYLDVEPEGA